MDRRIVALAVLTGCTEVSVSSLDNDAPVPKIFSHRDGDVLLEGYTVTLGGSVSDDGAVEDLVATWFVDDEGTCTGPLDELGNASCDWTVPAGEGVRIRLEAEDAHHAKGSALLDLAIKLTAPPVVDIDSPTASGRYYSNAPVRLAGDASDNEDEPEELAIAWVSDRDGALPGAATTPEPIGLFGSEQTLSEGRHTLTVTVTDVSGKTGTDAVTIDVGGPNTLPTCEITAPADGVESGQFNEVVFAGRVDDADIAADQLSVTWDSDGTPFGAVVPSLNGDVLVPWAELPLGVHTITMTVTDEVGGTCADAITHAVVEPPTAPVVHIEPAAPENGDDLVCVIDVASVDPQGDAVTYVFEWLYDGVSYGPGATTTLLGDTVTEASTAPGQVWECRASATDGRTTGSPGVDSVTIATPTVREVFAGGTHTCQLDTSDELTCWGNTTLNRLDLTNGFYASVGAGQSHTCAVDPYGAVACAGLDTSGQSTPPPGSGFVALDAGDSHNCAIDASQDLTCWGANVEGEGDASALTGNYVEVSSAFRHNCAVRTDAGLDCWGSGTFGRATPTPGVQWSHVSAGTYHTCGLDLTGLAVCFGRNLFGESSPPGGTFDQVSAGDAATCGVRGTGAIECWGQDTGPGLPLEPPAGTFTTVSVSDGFACAVDVAGAVTCWGDNTYGQCTAPLTWW